MLIVIRPVKLQQMEVLKGLERCGELVEFRI